MSNINYKTYTWRCSGSIELLAERLSKHLSLSGFQLSNAFVNEMALVVAHNTGELICAVDEATGAAGGFVLMYYEDLTMKLTVNPEHSAVAAMLVGAALSKMNVFFETVH